MNIQLGLFCRGQWVVQRMRVREMNILELRAAWSLEVKAN